MAMNGGIWLTAQDYNRLRRLLAELTRQSRGMQAGTETLEELLDIARVVHPEQVRRRRHDELSFRGYADDMPSADFSHHLSLRIAQAQNEMPMLMCAEAVPWRCHRSLIADALLVHGMDVAEILDARRYQRHRLTPFARVVGTKITYPRSGSPRAARAQALSGAPHPPPKSTAGADDA